VAITNRRTRPWGRAVLACAAAVAVSTSLPAEAHNPATVTGTIKHGGTTHGSTIGQRQTTKALKENGCTAPVRAGVDLNNFDAAVISLTGLAGHKVTATYTTTIEGTTTPTPAGAPPTGIYLDFLDKTCAPVPISSKEKYPDPYKVPTSAVTVPATARWLVVEIDAEGRSAQYAVTFKHPPPPPKPPKKKR
jgi:hypothetical protein